MYHMRMCRRTGAWTFNVIYVYAIGLRGLNPRNFDPSWSTDDDATIAVVVTFIHNSGLCMQNSRPTEGGHILKFERNFHLFSSALSSDTMGLFLCGVPYG